MGGSSLAFAASKASKPDNALCVARFLLPVWNRCLGRLGKAAEIERASSWGILQCNCYIEPS